MAAGRRSGWFFTVLATLAVSAPAASETPSANDKTASERASNALAKPGAPVDSFDAKTALWISSITAFRPTPTPFQRPLFSIEPTAVAGDRSFLAARTDGGLLFLSPLSPLRAVLRVAAAEARASLTTTVAAAEPAFGGVAESAGETASTSAEKRAAILRHRRRSVLNERDRDAVRDAETAQPREDEYEIEGLSGELELLSLPGRDGASIPGAAADRLPDGSGSVSLSGRLTDALRFTVTGLAVESASNAWRAGAEFDLRFEDHAVSVGAVYGRRFPSNAESQKNQGDQRGLGALNVRHEASFGRGISATWGGRLTRADYVKSGARLDPEVALVLALGELAGRNVAGDGAAYVRLETLADSLFPGQEALTGDGASIAFTEALALLARDTEAQRTWRSEAAIGRASADWRVEAAVRREGTRHALLVAPSAFAGAPLVRNLARPSNVEAIAFLERTFADSQAQASIEYAYGRFAEARSPFDPQSYHRLTARMDAYLRRTGTALVLFHRTHEGAPVAWRGFGPERVRHHRYLVEVRQDLPWVPRFVGADMAVLVGVRNVYYDDVDRRTLDEFAVLGPARRLTGGIRVQF